MKVIDKASLSKCNNTLTKAAVCNPSAHICQMSDFSTQADSAGGPLMSTSPMPAITSRDDITL